MHTLQTWLYTPSNGRIDNQASPHLEKELVSKVIQSSRNVTRRTSLHAQQEHASTAPIERPCNNSEGDTACGIHLHVQHDQRGTALQHDQRHSDCTA
eukprot:1158293-Pelagomonas_calceolata.AAC.10